MAEDIVLSPNGKKKIEDDLARLRNEELPALAERIRQARDLGDLSENFDYQDAKRQQGFVSGKIADLQAILERARIVECVAPGSSEIGMGSSVTVCDLDNDEEFTVRIVGSYEEDPDNDLISASSPMGKSLLGHVAGEEVSVDVPSGRIRYSVVSVA
jgi:transcription elongation factor GreA